MGSDCYYNQREIWQPWKQLKLKILIYIYIWFWEEETVIWENTERPWWKEFYALLDTGQNKLKSIVISIAEVKNWKQKKTKQHGVLK